MGARVDPRLEAFVAKTLAREPANRYQSAVEALGAWRELRPANAIPLVGPMTAIARGDSQQVPPPTATARSGPPNAAPSGPPSPGGMAVAQPAVGQTPASPKPRANLAKTAPMHALSPVAPRAPVASDPTVGFPARPKPTTPPAPALPSLGADDDDSDRGVGPGGTQLVPIPGARGGAAAARPPLSGPTVRDAAAVRVGAGPLPANEPLPRLYMEERSAQDAQTLLYRSSSEGSGQPPGPNVGRPEGALQRTASPSSMPLVFTLIGVLVAMGALVAAYLRFAQG